MPWFRKIPVKIYAQRFWIDSCPWPAGVLREGKQVIIETLEGPHLVSDGDWIITGVKGEKYPVKPDIFEMTYERVEEEEV